MLGKVLKYEFRSCGRTLLPFFGLSIAVSAVLRLLLFIAPRIWAPAGTVLASIASSLGILLLLAVIFIAFIVLTVRFFQSMVTNEAYLNFTLPVKAGTHITARLIVATLYSLLGFVVAFVCGLIFIPGFFNSLLNVSASISINLSQIPTSIILSGIALLVVSLIIGVATNFLQIYASIAIGTRFGSHRVLGSVVGYFILNTVESALLLPIAVIPMAGIAGWSNEEVLATVSSLITPDLATTLGNIMGLLWAFMGIILGISIVFAVIHFLLSNYFFSKKINLE